MGYMDELRAKVTDKKRARQQRISDRNWEDIDKTADTMAGTYESILSGEGTSDITDLINQRNELHDVYDVENRRIQRGFGGDQYIESDRAIMAEHAKENYFNQLPWNKFGKTKKVSMLQPNPLDALMQYGQDAYNWLPENTPFKNWWEGK